jgi:hypothetical protein
MTSIVMVAALSLGQCSSGAGAGAGARRGGLINGLGRAVFGPSAACASSRAISMGSCGSASMAFGVPMVGGMRPASFMGGYTTVMSPPVAYAWPATQVVTRTVVRRPVMVALRPLPARTVISIPAESRISIEPPKAPRPSANPAPDPPDGAAMSRSRSVEVARLDPLRGLR